VTAIDVLARRTRLSFLNSRSALDALPTVVDVMAQELGWSYAERKKQINDAVKFLESMGLTSEFLTPANIPAPIPRGWTEKAQASVWKATVGAVNLIWRPSSSAEEVVGSTRSKFEAGEVAKLKNAFVATGLEKVNKERLLDILKTIPGYSEVNPKELEYVLKEAALEGQEYLNLDEFIEVSGNLKEVVSAPVPNKKAGAIGRLRIPVEKSGGGV